MKNFKDFNVKVSFDVYQTNHLPMELIIQFEKEFEWVALRDVYIKELSIKNWEFM